MNLSYVVPSAIKRNINKHKEVALNHNSSKIICSIYCNNFEALQYSCLEKPMNHGSLTYRLTVHRVYNSDTLEQLSTHASVINATAHSIWYSSSPVSQSPLQYQYGSKKMISAVLTSFSTVPVQY